MVGGHRSRLRDKAQPVKDTVSFRSEITADDIDKLLLATSSLCTRCFNFKSMNGQENFLPEPENGLR